MLHTLPVVSSPKASSPVLKVCYLINGLGPGGAEHSLSELLPFFLEQGIQPTIVCLKRSDIGVEEDIRLTGCEIRFLPSGRWPTKVRALRTLLRAEPVDLIHTTLFDADVLGRVAAIGTGIPVLTSLVNTGYESVRLGDPRVSRGRLRGVQMVDAVTARGLTQHFHAITEAVKDSAIRTLGVPAGRITVVERGRSRERLGTASSQRRQEVRRRLGVAATDQVILNVARQEYQKGQRFLLEAVEPLLRSHPRLVVLIAGRPGHVTPELQTTLMRLDLSERVRFLGHRTDVPDLLAAADVFAFPSLYEGLGGAVIEAMAMGLPVVASDLPALREVVAHGKSGLLVESAAPEPLARALELLLDDASLAGRMGARGRAIFEDRFTIERSADRMSALYRSVVSTGRRA